jgi:hypothetical protein
MGVGVVFIYIRNSWSPIRGDADVYIGADLLWSPTCPNKSHLEEAVAALENNVTSVFESWRLRIESTVECVKDSIPSTPFAQSYPRSPSYWSEARSRTVGTRSASSRLLHGTPTAQWGTTFHLIHAPSTTSRAMAMVCPHSSMLRFSSILYQISIILE